MAREILNALSVDVEGFVESNVQSFAIDARYRDRARENAEIERNMEAVLALFDELGVRATFFFVGRLARALPQVVRRTARAGHEIGSHSHEHVRVFGEVRAEFRDRLAASKRDLEDVSGRPVVGFRAPDLSITRDSMWALDVLSELGFLYDSSVSPVDVHDVYGVAGAKPFIHTLANGLVEFPPSTVHVFGRRVPVAGGGYFRLYPLWLTRRWMRSINAQGEPCMFYIHPYEIGPDCPRIAGLTWTRRFRHYFRCAGGARRLPRALVGFRFAPVIEVLATRGVIAPTMAAAACAGADV